MTDQAAPPVDIHPGKQRDVEDASTALAAAFDDYPWTELTVPADSRAERLRSLYELILGEMVVPHGRLWVAREPGGRMLGAAGWLTPETDPPPALLTRIEEEVRRLRGGRAGAAALAEQAVAAVAAQSWGEVPHWFLGTAGVVPEARGRGVGTALLAAGLEAVDAHGAVARLETSLERNVRLYQRFGFTVSAGVTLPGDVPCWLMQREPRPGRTRFTAPPA